MYHCMAIRTHGTHVHFAIRILEVEVAHRASMPMVRDACLSGGGVALIGVYCDLPGGALD